MSQSQWKQVKGPSSKDQTKTTFHSKNPSYAKPLVSNNKSKIYSKNNSAKKPDGKEEEKAENDEVVFTIKMTKDEYMDYIQAKLKKKGF